MHGKCHLSFRQLIGQKTPATAINKGAGPPAPPAPPSILAMDNNGSAAGFGMVSDGS